MSMDLALPLVMRWMHVLSAVISAGGIVFLGFVLLPAAKNDSALMNAVLKKWRMIFHPLIILFLVSGFYNYLKVTSPKHDGQALYHALFGMKFLLALAYFVLGIALTSTRAYGERLRKNSRVWAAIVLVTFATIMLGGVMKVMPSAAATAAATPSAGATPGE
ncbi:MAG: hypothetical protein AAB353_04795 [Candidatus Hydrogenedentota bacterium]|mgnify:CR=1 FL=1